jgi:hypothetical protein
MLTTKPKHNSGIRVFMTFSGERCVYQHNLRFSAGQAMRRRPGYEAAHAGAYFTPPAFVTGPV